VEVWAREDARPPLASQAADDLKLDKVVTDAGAGAEFEPVADFCAEGVEGVGGTQAVAAALRVFAVCDVTAFGARFHCGFESHAKGTLSLGVKAVNDPGP
jgi:hypothetical protein